MRIIVSLDDTADAAAQADARRQLKRAGFRPARGQEHLSALGMLTGELPDAQFTVLQDAHRNGHLPGVASLDADAVRRISRDDRAPE